MTLGISAEDVLRALDQGARDFTFPMLDNGYVYPAASRLCVFSSDADWALVFEQFGFSPRSGVPHLLTTAFTSRPVHSKTAADYVNEEAYQNYLRNNSNVEQTWFHPIENESWIDPEDGESVSGDAAWLQLRGQTISLPDATDYAAAGVALEQPGKPLIFELCRALAAKMRDAVLATDAERRTGLVPGLTQVLCLDDWHHPNVVDSEALPSRTETFRQLAKVAVTADKSFYDSVEPPNTHWSNWPDGGTM